MLLPTIKPADLIRLRHPEWSEFQKRLRWLGDSLEGGDRYRNADYSVDPTSDKTGCGPFLTGLAISVGTDQGTIYSDPLNYVELIQRNLIPHRSEVGRDARATYDTRLVRTPVPNLLGRVIRRHMASILSHEVRREGPKELEAWWQDVDGLGTTIDKFARKVLGPLLFTYGHLDLAFDRPVADLGLPITTRQDQADAGLDSCVLSVVLPENMLWWKLDRQGRYVECLVLERPDGGIAFRHWNATGSTLYDKQGKVIGEPTEHSFGRVPIVRVFDERRWRCKNTGQPRFEEVAEYQKTIYNARSEEILSDLYQAHPILQVPEDMTDDSKNILVGPEGVLIAKVHDGQLNLASYLSPPKDADEARRKHIADYTDEVLAIACMSRPAGTSLSGTGSGTVAQSGISKMMDSRSENNLLSEMAQTLADAERTIVSYARMVLSDGREQPGPMDDVEIVYPQEFNLNTPEELAAAIGEFQGIMASAKDVPLTTGELIRRWLPQILVGLPDERINALFAEIDDFLADRSEQANQDREAASAGLSATDQTDTEDQFANDVANDRATAFADLVKTAS